MLQSDFVEESSDTFLRGIEVSCVERSEYGTVYDTEYRFSL